MIDFRHLAACRDTDPELFFPVGESGPARRQIAAAKAVCHRCPVTDECLVWALRAGHEYGVWGGRDMAERRNLHRRTRSGSSSPRPAPRVGAGRFDVVSGSGGCSMRV